MSKYQAILLFGAPGSGKGTVGKILALAGEHCHVSSGDIFRGLSPDSPAGEVFHQYASKGQLVPDEVTMDVWHGYVKGLVATNRYFPNKQLLILDGIPRTRRQAEILDTLVEVKKIVVLEAQDLTIFVDRLKRRALLEGREDDADEAVLNKRMEVYKSQTLSVLEHFDPRLVAEVNADQDRLEVLRDVISALS